MPTDLLQPLSDALLAPILAPDARTFLPFLAVAGTIGVGVEARRAPGPVAEVVRRGLGTHLWRSPSAALDLKLLLTRQLLRALGLARLAGGLGLAVGLALALDRWFGAPSPPPLPAWVVSILYTGALFVLGDLSRFLVHRAVHRIPALWEIHKVHHSADVLTPLSFHRIHPIESILFDVRGALVTGTVGGLAWWLWRGEAVLFTIAGVEALGFLLNGALGNLRHSHVWLGFPTRLEHWVLSPAQHQVHHSADPREHHSNFGTWIALWDRLGGSLRVSGERPPSVFGLRAAHQNHDDTLASALVDPMRAALRRARRSWSLAR